MDEVPIIHWETDIEPKVELFFGEESRNLPHYCLEQPSMRHVSFQIFVQMLVNFVVARLLWCFISILRLMVLLAVLSYLIILIIVPFRFGLGVLVFSRRHCLSH